MKRVTNLIPTPARRLCAATALVAFALAPLTPIHAAPPPPHNISAATFNVVQNDTGNTSNSVTVTSLVSVNDLRPRNDGTWSRGDFSVQVGDTGTNDLADGFILTSISQNGRSDVGETNAPNYGMSGFEGVLTPSNGCYWAVVQAANTGAPEYNANFAAAYFRYNDWLCGWARNSTAANGGANNLLTASPGIVLGTHYIGHGSGSNTVNLTAFGINSTNNPGVLLVNHAKNEGNYAVSFASPDGTWKILVKDDASNGTSLEQDPCAFVFIPRTNTTVVSGKFGLDATGTNATILIYSGTSPAFTVTNIAIGRYRLTIPGYSNTRGVLIISPEGGNANNADNFVSYELDGDGWIIEARDAGSFPQPLEAGTNAPVASFCFIPGATPGFTVSPTNGLTTTEFGLTANFTVTLDTQPTNDVAIGVSSSDLTEGTVSTNALTFTPANWNIPQTVTVTGANDALQDGNIAYTIVLSAATSLDADYNGLNPADVSLINVDDDQVGITVTPTSGVVSEPNSNTVFSIVLAGPPSADVTIGLSSSDLTEGTVSPNSVTFTPGNWSVPQQVTVTAVDDFLPDGDIAFTIVTAPAVSAAPGYNGFNAVDFSVVNQDTDVPQVVSSVTQFPITVAEGSSTNYTVSLSTQPAADVVVQFDSSNPAIGTVNPASITLTPLNWATPQVITVSGVENLTDNGTVLFAVTNNIISSDPNYQMPPTNVVFPVAVLDNEPRPPLAAANLNVVQNDTGNTEASVTVTTTTSVNGLQARTGSNRGDYNLQVGESATDDLAEGLPMVAVSQNGRYNLDESSEPFYGAPAFDGGAAGYWAVLQDCTDARAEYNVNCAVGFFRYNSWLAGWARNSTAANGGANNLFTGSPGLTNGVHYINHGTTGSNTVNLLSFGVNSTNSGVLIVNHAKNEGNFATAYSAPDGTWKINVKDNFGNATNDFAREQDPCAFVFIPKTNTTVVSGKFGLDDTGTNAVILLHSDVTPSFAITNISLGRYRLTIPNMTPAKGVLITSCEGGYPINFNNVISYEADGDGWIIESRSTGVYPPALEACTNEPVASFVFIPAIPPGLTVTPKDGLITTEFGGTASFTVKLDTIPTSDVTIGVSAADATESSVSTNSLTFTPANWNAPQTVTVTGVDDALVDGAITNTIVLAAATSADPAYSGLNPADVTVVNMDDEQAGITVTPTLGLLTGEGGSSATFTVFLNRQPSNSVTIGLASSDLTEGTVSPASLTFTTNNWSTPQVVTVTGVDDFQNDGTIDYVILLAPATSADPSYNGLNPADVSVRNVDNDVPGYVWNYSLPLTVIEGSSINYTLALATQPFSNVVVQVASDNTGAGTVSPTTLTFTPGNWNVPQTITLHGVDNLFANDDIAFHVNHTPVTTDPTYALLSSTISLNAVLVDNEAKFTLPSGDCIYGLGMPAIGLDGQAALSDPDAASYNNGAVTVTITNNGSASDVLAIRNTGTGLGQISVSGTNVSYEGNVIGAVTGGTGLTPLSVTLNGNATVPAVQQLLRSITFTTPTLGASLATRSAVVSVGDGLGGLVADGKSIRVGALRKTEYQEGGDYGYGNYFGAADIALSEVGSFEPWPIGRSPAEGLLMDWPDGGTPNESQVLLRFDSFVGTNYWQVPSNAIILSAELLLNINNTGDGARFYRMLVPWDSTNETWISMGAGVQQDDVESSSVYQSQLGVEDGSGATGTGIVAVGVARDIQAWVDGTNNFGWVMKGWPLRTDGTAFSPSEDPNVSLRPRLRVKWLQPGFASATFQQGVNDYTNTFDANLAQATPDVNLVTSLSIGSDANDAGNTNATQGLLWFDNIIGTGTNQIPPGAQIHGAVLELASVGPDAMGDGGQIFAVLQPWDPNTTTWNTWGNGVQPDGIEAALTQTAVAGSTNLNPDVQGTFNYFEVTADVQAWANGTRTNYGWAVLPWTNGSNGWFSRSSEAVSFVDVNHPEAEHPRLRVYYSATPSATPAVLGRPSVTAVQVQVPFAGSPGVTYTVLRAPAVTGPWNAIGSVTVAPSGQATNTDNAPLPGRAFYRVVYP